MGKKQDERASIPSPLSNKIDDSSIETVDKNFVNSTNKQSKKVIFIIIFIILFLSLLFIGIFVFKKYFVKFKDLNITKKTEINNTIANNADKKRKSDSNCQVKYDKLIQINGFDFDKYCFVKSARKSEYNASSIKQKKKNLVLIFDASGSMAQKIGNKRKIDIAKEATWKFIDQVANEENFNLSIVVYGHKGSNRQSDKQLSCNGIEEIYYLGDVNVEIAKSKLNKFDATGWTPIAKSFEKAQKILSDKKNDENFILLVSDGKEMCDGDPVATIKQLKQSGLNVVTDVIGFDVGSVDEVQLKAIAEAGDGDYFSVSSAVDLENAFAKHKEMLNKTDFKIGQTLTNLYDISYIINDYNQCRTMLEKEKAAMMLDIHIRKLTGTKCENDLDVTYKQRYQQVRQKIEENYQQGKASFEKNSIK